MKSLPDCLRAILFAPEVVCALIPFLGYIYAPALADVLIKPMKDNFGFGVAAAALPLGMLVFNYKESLELLSPSGAGRVLLQWPDYPMLKARVLIALAWCATGLLGSIAGVWTVAVDLEPRLGIAIVAAGILAACAATATIGLARFRLRELLGE